MTLTPRPVLCCEPQRVAVQLRGVREFVGQCDCVIANGAIACVVKPSCYHGNLRGACMRKRHNNKC